MVSEAIPDKQRGAAFWHEWHDHRTALARTACVLRQDHMGSTMVAETDAYITYHSLQRAAVKQHH